MVDGKEAFWIGSVQVLPDRFLIEVEGRPVKLEPKVMDLLLYLADHPGQVVSKEQLLEDIWSDSYVGEEVLTRGISALRKALGDNAKKPTFIETIVKRGYRLIAPVSISSQTGSTVKAYEKEVPSRTPKPLLLGGLFAAVIMTWVLIYALHQLEPPKTYTPVTPQAVEHLPGTAFPGHEYYSAFSPDGSMFAMVWEGYEGGQNYDIYIKMMGEETPKRMTDHPADETQPTWSPEGNYIYFIRKPYGDEKGGIYVVPLIGGPARRVPGSPETPMIGLSHSPTKPWLAYTTRKSPGEPYRAFLFNIDQGLEVPISSPDTGTFGDTSIHFSWDGSQIAFTRSTELPDEEDIYWVDLQAPQDPKPSAAVRISFDRDSINGFAWTADNRHMVVVSNRSGSYSFWKLSVTGEYSTLPYLGSGPIMAPYTSARSGRLSYTKKVVEQNIWRYSLDKTSNAKRLIASSRLDLSPVYAPDGSRIAFISERSGHPEIWTADSDGQYPMQITNFGGESLANPRWAPDSRSIIFERKKLGHTQLIRLYLENGNTRIIGTEHGNNRFGSISPDGQYVYFTADISGSWNIWRHPSGGGTKEQMTSVGGYGAYAAPGGRYLYFSKFNAPGIWRQDIYGGEPIKVVEDLPAAKPGFWQLVDQNLYYLINETSEWRLYHYDINTQITQVLTTFDGRPGWESQPFSISPDMTWVIFGKCERMESDIYVTEPLPFLQ